MSFLLTQAAETRLVEVTVSSKLTKEAYQAIIQSAKASINKNGKIRVLLLTLGFNGWNAGAQWGDIECEIDVLSHTERLAIVGETKWETQSFSFCRPFTAAQIQYFEQRDLEKAREWIRSSMD